MQDFSLSETFKEKVPDRLILERYASTLYTIVAKVCPKLQPFEISEAINYSISKRFRTREVKIHNNHINTLDNVDITRLIDSLLKDSMIMSTQGVLFAKHGTVKNPFYNLIQYFLDKREEAKEKMKTFPKGSKEYDDYNLLQKNYKVACNALYGCAGQYSSIYYNLYLCTAVTGQGRGCISAAITMFESFLANNVKFGSLTEVLTFIDNICLDLTKPRKFNDYMILDRMIGVEECFLKVMHNCGFNSWVPSDEAVKAIWNTINNLNQEQLNMVYYKNNLYTFCENRVVSEIIIRILVTLDKPFLNPNKPPKEIMDDLTLLKDLMYEYVYYRHIYIDKIERVYTMIRDVVLLTDTDSCVVSLDEWYRYVLPKTMGIPMNIKYTKEEIMEVTDKVIMEYQHTEPTNEYDFYNDKLVEKKRLTYPAVIIEEDNLRYSIINIISNIVSNLIMDYMVLFSENYNTKGDRKCLLIMKNEFLFRAMLLKLYQKKNYASQQLLQEGNIIPEDKQFDIKGMPIYKMGIPESTSKKLSDFIEFDILRKSFVDQVDLLKKFVIFEREIYASIKAKNKEYHKPARIKSLSNYKNPMSVQGIKASVAYNTIKSRDEEGINLEERNTVLIIKVNISKKNANLISETHPEHFLRLMKLLETKGFSDISAIAIPTNIEIPDWIIPFIDYTTIIQDNLRSFPFEEIGISKMESKTITHSNILSL